MRNEVVKSGDLKFRNGGRAFILAVLFCLQFNAPYAEAQEIKFISHKPLITQEFSPARNETEVKLALNSRGVSANPVKIPFGDKKSDPILIYSPAEPGARTPIQSDMLLGYASYIYEGKNPTGKQGVTFTFYSKSKDTFKDQPAFSISVGEQIIQEGVVDVAQQLAPDEDFRQKVIVRVPTDVFLRVARSKKVQFTLGLKTYKPEGFQQKSMRALADIIDPQSK
jgi:hypothetical protein